MSIVINSAQCSRCLNLWNGTQNNPEPDGWPLDTFDDSTWPQPTDAQKVPSWVTAGQPMWSNNLPLSRTDICLFRHHIALPSDLVSATIIIACDDELLSFWVNGANLTTITSGSSTPSAPQAIDLAQFIYPGDNIIAFEVANNSAPGPSNFANLSYQLTLMTTADTQAGAGTTSGSADANSESYGQPLGAGSGYGRSAWRIVHADGDTCIEHDGVLCRVRTRNKTVLQAPFPTMSGQPNALLGRDPASGLPMWTGVNAPPAPPPPSPVSTTYSKPDRSLEDTHSAPMPLPIPPNKQRVCGAAYAMAYLTCGIYNGVVQVINKDKNNIINNFTQELKAEIGAEIVSLLTEAEFAQWQIAAAEVVLTVLTAIVETLLAWGTNLPLIYPPYPDSVPWITATSIVRRGGVSPSQQWQFLLCTAWQALWLTGGDYFSEVKSADGFGTKDFWIQNLAPQWSFFAGSTISGINQANPPWQLVWINAILKNVPDVGWALAASLGAQLPRNACSGCTGYPP